MKLNEYQLISLAGFLHDTGKLRQRADLKIENEYNWQYCPEDKNTHRPSYVHAAHSAEFLDWFVDKFKIESFDSESNLVNISANHHRRDNGSPMEEIIKVADRLSSGFEREDSYKKGKYNKDRLESIFSQVWLDNKPSQKFYPIEKLNPSIVPSDQSQGDDDYKKLYKDFLEDLGKIRLKNDRFDVFWDALEYVFETYTWSVPSSSYYSYPRISLFDHSKTTAAIAQAIYAYHKFKNSMDVNNVKNCKENEFLLVQGDFSGIQNFIFSRMGESNKFAAKILRARSFYVSLSTDLAAYSILRKIGLTKAGIIMNAGGKFTLLLPNTKDAKNSVVAVEDEINSYFNRLSFGETRFVIAYTKASRGDFKFKENKSSFSDKMGELANLLEMKKLQPEIDKFVFDDYLDDYKNRDLGVCSICGKHIATKKEQDSNICEYCSMFKDIGTKLVNKKSFYITEGSGSYGIFNNLFLSFKNDNKAVLVFDLKNSEQFSGFAKTKISGYVPRIEQEELDIRKYDKLEDEIDEGAIKTFEMIAEDAKTANESGEFVGESFLGILKADVDNLGRIFIEGIKGHLSISKYVSLSRMMDFFFTGWLQNILSEKYKSVYTVFSGGDDLFLIGPFSQIIDLAQEINHHLKEYVKNEDIHLSCGIYFAKDKIPVYQMAENSETILEEAKYSDKNRIGLFGRVVKWDRFDKIMEDEDFVGFLNNNNVSSGFKYSLFWFSDRAENLVNKKIGFNSKDLKWKALLSYQVYRNVDKDNRGDYLQLLIDRIEKYRGDLRISLSNYLYRNRRRG
jgi:CRISPR-associated protein Csm1